MDLQERRISCLRMAVEMGCKANSVFRTDAPAAGAESAAPEMSAGEAAKPAVEAIAAVETAPAAAAPLAEPILAEQPAAVLAIAETTFPTAGDAPTPGASAETPPPEPTEQPRRIPRAQRRRAADVTSARPARSAMTGVGPAEGRYDRSNRVRQRSGFARTAISAVGILELRERGAKGGQEGRRAGGGCAALFIGTLTSERNEYQEWRAMR